jgi:hypothetical protein
MVCVMRRQKVLRIHVQHACLAVQRFAANVAIQQTWLRRALGKLSTANWSSKAQRKPKAKKFGQRKLIPSRNCKAHIANLEHRHVTITEQMNTCYARKQATNDEHRLNVGLRKAAIETTSSVSVVDRDRVENGHLEDDCHDFVTPLT